MKDNEAVRGALPPMPTAARRPLTFQDRVDPIILRCHECGVIHVPCPPRLLLPCCFSSSSDLAGDGGLTCYDGLTKGVGPACLLVVVRTLSIRHEGSVAVKPAAALALADLLLEPLFSAYVLGAFPSGLVREGVMAGLLDLHHLPRSIFGKIAGGRGGG